MANDFDRGHWSTPWSRSSSRHPQGTKSGNQYVERESDQLDYTLKPPQNTMPYRPKAGKRRAYGYKPRTSSKKRKRLTRSYKPRKVVRKKYKKTTAASFGLMDVSKSATAPKAHSIVDRRKTYGAVVNTLNSKMCWLGGSDVGDQKIFLRAIARAVLQKYLVKLGDIRTSASYDQADLSTELNQIWRDLIVQYIPEAYNTVHEASSVGSQINGAVITNGRLDTMADALGDQFMQQAERGFYPSDITIYGTDFVTATGSGIRGRPIIYDNRFGEHIVDAQVTTLFRLHNISPSDTTDAGENPGNTVHDINANPISGKIFTFRNQRPVFHAAYAQNQRIDPTTRDGMEFLNRYDSAFDVIKAPSDTVDAFAHISAPPLNARSIWSNVSGQGTLRMAPGAYRTYNCKFARSLTLRSIIRDTIRVRVDVSDNGQGVTSKNPPLGSSFLFCFQPSMRSSGSETVKLAYDQTQIYKIALRYKKQMGLPTRNIMQA